MNITSPREFVARRMQMEACRKDGRPWSHSTRLVAKMVRGGVTIRRALAAVVPSKVMA